MRPPPGLGLWTIKWPQQLWTTPPTPHPHPIPDTLDFSDQPAPSLPSHFRPVINTSSPWPSSCCYCHTAKFGPHVQSPGLPVNQLNQQSLIPDGYDRFIKGLISATRCFSQPNHFPRSRVTQKQGYEIFPHTLLTPPKSIREHHVPQITWTL